MVFSIVSWNIQGKLPLLNTRFKKIAPVLSAKPADIVCLQEARLAKLELHTLRAFDEHIKIVPRTTSNHNVLFSKFPVCSYGELEFPQLSVRRLENALWADVIIHENKIRIYNCHFGLYGSGPATRMAQLHTVLSHADSHDGPAIITGDLNSAIPRKGLQRTVLQTIHLAPLGTLKVRGEHFEEDERYLIARVAEEHGFREALDLSHNTWRMHSLTEDMLTMKLDWLLLRDIQPSDVTLQPYISDHRAIHANCVLTQE